MKWIVTFVVCFVLNESVGAPQGQNLRDDDEFLDDFMRDATSVGGKRVRREDGRTVMDILMGNVPTDLDYVVESDEGNSDDVRITRSVDEPMLISPGPMPCSQSRDSGTFDGPYQEQYFNPAGGPQIEPKTHKLPVLPALPVGGIIGGGHGGHVGLIGHQESFLEPVHKETIYYATIPFISGYKLTPIVSNKKIIVKDLPGHGHDGLIGGGIGHSGIGGGIGGGGLLHDGLLPGLSGLPGLPGLSGLPGLPGLSGLPGLPGLTGLPAGFSLDRPSASSRSAQPYPQPDYVDYPCTDDLDGSFAQSRSSHPQDFYIPDPGARHPLDLNIFFENPEAVAARDAAPEILTPEMYADAIRNLQQQMDHLHSLKLAHERRTQPDDVNCV